jgi:hypothetical protein
VHEYKQCQLTHKPQRRHFSNSITICAKKISCHPVKHAADFPRAITVEFEAVSGICSNRRMNAVLIVTWAHAT